MTPDKAWKRLERDTAKQIGGKRTWWLSADTKGPRMSIECKYRKELPQYLKDWVAQAEANAEVGEFAAVRLREKHKRKTYLICDWDTFLEWFGNFSFPMQGKDGLDK